MQGASDQGMMNGFACTYTPELMPLTISLAHRLTRQLALVRKSGELPWLLPDGKSQVTIEYAYGKPQRVEAVVISSHHRPGVGNGDIEEGVRGLVIDPVLPRELVDSGTKVLVNPSGRFELGGPAADAGLTGRKIIVDTYGGVARHGGGAFSGKDPSKVDRSAAYYARFVAKNVVAAKLAARCEVQVAYAIGVADPVSVLVDTFGTGVVPDEKIGALVRDLFDFKPASLIQTLGLKRPIYRRTAAYGHFGRVPDGPHFTWERTDRVDDLRSAAGLGRRS